MLIFTYSNIVDKWSPALQIRTVLLSIQALLSAPNPDDPLANDVASHWKENERDAIEQGINENALFLGFIDLILFLYSSSMDRYVCASLRLYSLFYIKEKMYEFIVAYIKLNVLLNIMVKVYI